METYFVAIAQLIFVTIVYCVAYRVGYRAAHHRAVTIVQECQGPMHEMLDRLSCPTDETFEEEKEEG